MWGSPEGTWKKEEGGGGGLSTYVQYGKIDIKLDRSSTQ